MKNNKDLTKDNKDVTEAPEVNEGCCGGGCCGGHDSDSHDDGKTHEEAVNLDSVCEKCEQMEGNWMRALADYKNLEKRVAEEKIAVISFSNSILLLRMLPVLDNLEMMVKHSEDEGLKMTIKEFKKILKEEGVEEIEAEGKDFDAATMDAVEMIEGKKDKVIEVTQAGFMLKNKVLRPAIVKVGRGKDK